MFKELWSHAITRGAKSRPAVPVLKKTRALKGAGALGAIAPLAEVMGHAARVPVAPAAIMDPAARDRRTLGLAVIMDPVVKGHRTLGPVAIMDPAARGRRTLGPAAIMDPAVRGRRTLGRVAIMDPAVRGRRTLGRVATTVPDAKDRPKVVPAAMTAAGRGRLRPVTTGTSATVAGENGHAARMGTAAMGPRDDRAATTENDEMGRLKAGLVATLGSDPAAILGSVTRT